MSVRLLADLCVKHGVRKVVFSPGSRLAPIYIAFSQIPEVECIVIPDERVAGYFALGMAQQLNELVAVVCTSGTAVFNLAPSFNEAFHQKVRMIYITADRPEGAAYLRENQAVEQHNPFGMLPIQTFCVHGEKDDEESFTHLVDDFETENRYSIRYNYPFHINVHLDDPLYEMTNEPLVQASGSHVKDEEQFDEEDYTLLNLPKMQKEFSSLQRKMIVVGMYQPTPEISRRLTQLSHRKDIIIVRETTSNLSLKNSISNAETTFNVMDDDIADAFCPELVVRLGGRISSKKLNSYLKGHGVKTWEVLNSALQIKTWGRLNMEKQQHFRCPDVEMLDILLGAKEIEDSSYRDGWMNLSTMARKQTDDFLSSAPFSDLKVFETIITSFPNDANIQYGNSTPIRYSNYFRHQTPGLSIHANRGTSGIDGCLSTAAGAAYVNGKITISIVGDISFFYDSNALWNNYLSPHLRIIMINNSGGNIFRLIDGPSTLKNFEQFFETRHNLTAQHIAAHHDLPYYYCDNQTDLEKILKTFYETRGGKPAILEIKTDAEISASVHKNYFNYLKNHA